MIRIALGNAGLRLNLPAAFNVAYLAGAIRAERMEVARSGRSPAFARRSSRAVGRRTKSAASETPPSHDRLRKRPSEKTSRQVRKFNLEYPRRQNSCRVT